MLHLLASGSTSTLSDPFTYLTGLGFPGIVIGLLITGQLRTKSEAERLIEENRRKDEIIIAKDRQLEALQASIVDKAIPALTRSTQVLESLQKPEVGAHDELSTARREIAEVAARLERLTTQNNQG